MSHPVARQHPPELNAMSTCASIRGAAENSRLKRAPQIITGFFWFCDSRFVGLTCRPLSERLVQIHGRSFQKSASGLPLQWLPALPGYGPLHLAVTWLVRKKSNVRK